MEAGQHIKLRSRSNSDLFFWFNCCHRFLQWQQQETYPGSHYPLNKSQPLRRKPVKLVAQIVEYFFFVKIALMNS